MLARLTCYLSTRLTSTPQEKSLRQLGPNSFIATQLSPGDSFSDACKATWNSALAAVMRPGFASGQEMMSKPRSSITSSSDEPVINVLPTKLESLGVLFPLSVRFSGLISCSVVFAPCFFSVYLKLTLK